MSTTTAATIASRDLVWAMGSFCALNRLPFDSALLLQQIAPPYDTDSFVHAARAMGLAIVRQECDASAVRGLDKPCMVILRERSGDELALRPAIVFDMRPEGVVLFEAETNTPKTVPDAEFGERFAALAFQVGVPAPPLKDPDAALASNQQFGFRTLLPELLKHKRVWRDVLIASLVIQLLALGMPLFTQVVIDKVVVHRTESTLWVIGVGMALFVLFTMLLTWVRQYLVLHTGNRVDAALGSAVFTHLLKLPLGYFQHRPTGVIAARLHGVETIREFVASAAVTLVLDLPFLLIFVGIMFYYSVTLTLVTLALIGAVVVLSVVVAPIFRARLNHQFLLGARSQAFVTEYVAGMETVKSLQMEPQLVGRYGTYLAEYLHAGFRMKQLANGYSVAANGVEQLMTLLILVIGAYTVMHDAQFTIGMLVAFQMFAGRVSQPMLRLVSLWQQFQQANLSVQRLGDIMNAPPEPYSAMPNRVHERSGRIEIEDVSFRYSEQLPWLYQHLHLAVQPGRVVALMGPSGSGKSTLAKLLQGFYVPSAGQIRVDGTDIRHLAANELRMNFGVVPQETLLFSGTIYDNLLMASPHATFEQVVQACRMAEIHEVIERLPEGYRTEIGERGAGLSGGQKQRLAIARALLKQPKVLIFDEATSSLDPDTAEHLAATINQLKGRVTILFIAHALPKALHVDEVVRIGTGAAPSVGLSAVAA